MVSKLVCVDEEVLIKIAKRIAVLELFVKKNVIGDCTTDEYCRKEFDRTRLDMLVHDVSLGYCDMLKDALFQMTFSTNELLEDLGYNVRDNDYVKKNILKEDVQREKSKR